MDNDNDPAGVGRVSFFDGRPLETVPGNAVPSSDYSIMGRFVTGRFVTGRLITGRSNFVLSAAGTFPATTTGWWPILIT